MKNSNDFCFCSKLKTNSEIQLVRKERVWAGASAPAQELEGLEGSRRSPGANLCFPLSNYRGDLLGDRQEVLPFVIGLDREGNRGLECGLLLDRPGSPSVMV